MAFADVWQRGSLQQMSVPDYHIPPVSSLPGEEQTRSSGASSNASSGEEATLPDSFHLNSSHS